MKVSGRDYTCVGGAKLYERERFCRLGEPVNSEHRVAGLLQSAAGRVEVTNHVRMRDE